ncbi:eukaryotic translation initiation factor 3 [Echinococcus multilocularis]|uniref:Eukaryotic translation initiation factor 3 subunit L n=1 Tax=Echinococcus multilocularis TaxID=6211 RepID=A0A068YJM6_ECHMU|nr:eukaryotic translation initiation factor 3 [Echinococcus multilocularis]
MAGTREGRQAGETGVSKAHDDPYKALCADVEAFIKSFYKHVKSNDLAEIENDYVVKFPKLTEQYFKTTRWPPAEAIAPLVNKDSIFMMLYNELFYRHLYAHVTSFPELEEAHQSYLNYCALFDALLKPKNPVQLELPNQWLWDIIDEFIYQFQKFSTYRSKLKRKPEDDVFLGLNPSTWSIQGVLSILFQLVEKSNINLQLSYYAMQRDPYEVAGPFGQCDLYKMLGFFSLVGLCRVHCLLGDYFTALKMLEHVQLSRQEMYHEVPTCHITTGYYVGFAYLMMRRFQDAVRTFTHTLAYIARVSACVAQRPDLREYVVKQADQMTSLLAICITINPMPIDQAVEQHLKEKFAESLNRLQQTNKDEFTMCFDIGCPRFINPDAKATERVNYALDAQRHQGVVFRSELDQYWIELPRLRSFLKLYTSLPVEKLGHFLEEDEENVHSLLMRFKHQLKNVTCTGETCGSLEGTLQLLCDTDFYVDGEMIHIADMKVDRRFSEFFMLQLEKLRELNDQLDEVEKKLSTARLRA